MIQVVSRAMLIMTPVTTGGGEVLVGVSSKYRVAGGVPRYDNHDPCDLRGPTGGGGVLVRVSHNSMIG